MAGFCSTMKEEKNSEMKEHVLDYVIALLEDANDFSWVPKRPAMQCYCVAWNKGRFLDQCPAIIYNQDSCVHDKTHETKGKIYKHICSACFVNWGKSFTNTETQCRNKNKKSQSKNLWYRFKCLYRGFKNLKKTSSNQVCMRKKCEKLGIFRREVCKAGLARLVL